MNEERGAEGAHEPAEGGMPGILIAHRGEPSSYPENSLVGFEAVLRAGAAYLETDIQLTADGVPVLCHDPDVVKVTGQDYVVMQTDYATLAVHPAGYPSRFGAQYADVRLARLEELVTLLKSWSRVRALIEVKEESINAFGTAHVMDRVLSVLHEALAQCIIISFAREPLMYTRRNSSLPIGWVLSEWSDASRAAAQELQPDYLICNRKRLPAEPQPLWPGPWRWIAYTVNTVEDALALRRRGVALLETDVIRALLNDPKPAWAGHD
jgi:glycerophosphoryl diester phosphodiesterase